MTQCFINEESLDYLLFKKLPMNVYSKKFTKSTDLNRQPNSCVAWKVLSKFTFTFQFRRFSFSSLWFPSLDEHIQIQLGGSWSLRPPFPPNQCGQLHHGSPLAKGYILTRIFKKMILSGLWSSCPHSDLLAWPFVLFWSKGAFPLLWDFPQIPWSVQEPQQL